MYKLILLDYCMPEMDGPETAREITRLFNTSLLLSERDRPYIVCCSAYGEASFVKSALEAGMNQFVNKPLTFKSLEILCSEHLL